MNIHTIINQTEGRRLEFKESMPTRSDLAKTVVAFANDAGGDIYIGVRNNPRKIIGIPETELVILEEQISNIIYNKCYPGIIPEISFLNTDSKHLIKVSVYRGSMPPYYLKEKGKLQGAYISWGVGVVKRRNELTTNRFLKKDKYQINAFESYSNIIS